MTQFDVYVRKVFLWRALWCLFGSRQWTWVNLQDCYVTARVYFCTSGSLNQDLSTIAAKTSQNKLFLCNLTLFWTGQESYLCLFAFKMRKKTSYCTCFWFFLQEKITILSYWWIFFYQNYTKYGKIIPNPAVLIYDDTL